MAVLFPMRYRECNEDVLTFLLLIVGVQVASARFFSSSADVPPHQEIGMPSLSPTMTEGNIARWLK